MLILVIVCIIGGYAYFACPLPIQLLLTAINAFVPDPIPFLDEIIMAGGIFSKLYYLDDIGYYIEEFFAEHKILSAIIIGIVIVIVVNLIG